MMPPADEIPAVSRNFFLPPAVGATSTLDAKKIQTTKLLQDAHMLQQLEQSYHIDQFLNNPSPIDETTITFADNITQALGDALRSTPYEYPSSDAPTFKRPHRRPKRLSRHNTASSVGGSSVSRKSKRCYLCGTTDTPRWQEAGLGSRLFCNVCGLLHSKKLTMRKHLAQSSRGDTMSTTDSAWS
ncbi:hypothetical protein FG05_07830 [Fusarium graminearum]|nr:hypothetical protein FG05_07830 [Fusarium graminearum]